MSFYTSNPIDNTNSPRLACTLGSLQNLKFLNIRNQKTMQRNLKNLLTPPDLDAPKKGQEVQVTSGIMNALKTLQKQLAEAKIGEASDKKKRSGRKRDRNRRRGGRDKSEGAWYFWF